MGGVAIINTGLKKSILADFWLFYTDQFCFMSGAFIYKERSLASKLEIEPKSSKMVGFEIETGKLKQLRGALFGGPPSETPSS